MRYAEFQIGRVHGILQPLASVEPVDIIATAHIGGHLNPHVIRPVGSAGLSDRSVTVTVNSKQSAVGRPWKRKFLGFSLSVERVRRLRVAPEAVERFKDKLRAKFRAGRGAI